MATLTSSYQFLGRSPVMTSTNGDLSYYLLLYGKTLPNKTTGIHTVTIKSVLASTTNNATYYYYTQAHSGTINGTTAFSGTNKPSDPWELSSFSAGGVAYKTGTLLGEGSVDVDCTNGQAKDIALSCYYAFNGNAHSYTPAKGTNRTVSVTATLSAIPREATLLTAPNFGDGDNPTITYSNPAGNSVDSLQACICDESGSVVFAPYREIPKTGSSYTFTLTSAERSALQNAASGNSLSVKFAIRTAIGSNIWYSALIRTMTINNANPVVTASVVDTNATTIALTGDSKKLIKYYSNAYATMTAVAQKGASIDESLYIIRNGNSTGYGTSHTFNNVESNIFTFSAEDSRGNIGTATVAPTMVNYVRLTCYLRNNRPDASGNMTVECEGDYFNGSFGAVSNTLTVQYRYKVQGGSYGQWQNMTVSKNGNWYGAQASLDIPNFDYQNTYVFECQAIDKLETVTSTAGSAKSVPVFHWGENDFVFEVPVSVNGDCNVSGDLRLKGSGNYGNTLYFGDGSYTTISEPSDDTLKLKATAIDLDALSISVYGSPLADFVVEQGISNGWTYQKWNSGIAECWCKTIITVSSSSQQDSLYYSNNISLSLPFAMTDTITSGSIDNVAYVCNASLSGSTLVFLVARAATELYIGKYRVELCVKGRWK